jgi:hypothetical protein
MSAACAEAIYHFCSLGTVSTGIYVEIVRNHFGFWQSSGTVLQTMSKHCKIIANMDFRLINPGIQFTDEDDEDEDDEDEDDDHDDEDAAEDFFDFGFLAGTCPIALHIQNVGNTPQIDALFGTLSACTDMENLSVVADSIIPFSSVLADFLRNQQKMSRLELEGFTFTSEDGRDIVLPKTLKFLRLTRLIFDNSDAENAFQDALSSLHYLVSFSSILINIPEDRYQLFIACLSQMHSIQELVFSHLTFVGSEPVQLPPNLRILTITRSYLNEQFMKAIFHHAVSLEYFVFSENMIGCKEAYEKLLEIAPTIPNAICENNRPTASEMIFLLS